MSVGSSVACVLLLAALIPGPQVPEVMSVELKPKTLEAFERYVKATEARIDKQRASPETFLYIDELPEPKRAEALATLKAGNVYMESLITRDESGKKIEARSSLIHHWIGDVFIPGVSLRQVLDAVQDYDRHQNFYPEVVRSRLLNREGNDFKIALRIRYKKIITVTLNTEHDVRYTELDSTHWYSRSVSTRIAEVKDADSPNESEKPVGNDGGFLWRLDSYWGFVEQDGGVYVECESVSLTRDIPAALGWLIRPFVTGIPRESLQHTLSATRTAALARVAAPSQSRK